MNLSRREFILSLGAALAAGSFGSSIYFNSRLEEIAKSTLLNMEKKRAEYIDTLAYSVPRIRARTTLVDNLGKEKVEAGIGLAVPVNNKTIITAYHVLKENTTTNFSTKSSAPSGLSIKDAEYKLDYFGIVHDLDILYEDADKDLIIAQSDSDFDPFPAKLGDSDDIRLGEEVIFLGCIAEEPYVSGGKLSCYGHNLFIMSDADVEQGFSGGPILRYDGMEPEIIGITAGIGNLPNIMTGMCVRINYFKEALNSLGENYLS